MKKFHEIAEFGKKLISLDDMHSAIEIIADEAKMLVNADRCSIYIIDNEDKMLWTTLSDGLGKIVISLDAGIVGDTYRTKEVQIVNNPYEDERFLSNIDKKSGYITKNMITIPIFDSKREVMGIIQLLNKDKVNFNEDDSETLTFFANYVSGSLELALLSSKQ